MITMKELGAPIRQWVPDWLGLICIFIVILPVTMLNGSYTGSMLEVSNTLGTNTEDITMGYYAAAAGMAVSYPIIPKILEAFSIKFLLLADLVAQFFLSWICARSQNADILIVCSFAIGFLKGFLMLWFIRYAQKIFSPKNIRSQFYSYFYPFVFGGGQASMLVTAQLAYHYDWKYMYYFMMLMILLAILVVIICFRHNRPIKSIPLADLHIREMFIISTGLLMLMYVINYGKVLDWMASPKICLYIMIAPILIALFIWYQYHSERPYVNLAPLYQPKAIIGYFYMMLVMFFSTSTTLLTSYLTSILKVDSTHTYSLYTYLLPGYVLGAFICFWWFRWQRWRFRFLIAGGMSCFVLFFGSLYFGISPDSRYEILYFPIFLRGLGMMILIIAFALFAVEDLIERTFQKLDQADIVLWMIDATDASLQIAQLSEKILPRSEGKQLILVFNKADLLTDRQLKPTGLPENVQSIFISAKKREHIDKLQDLLIQAAHIPSLSSNDVIVTNIRHYEALTHALESIHHVQEGLSANLSGDFISQDLRECIFHLSDIVGEVTTDQVLGNIFERFCIGK